MKTFMTLFFFLMCLTLFSREIFPIPQLHYQPRNYICYRTVSEIIIDGQLNESDWKIAHSAETFVDIEGDFKPLPYHQTQVKML